MNRVSGNEITDGCPSIGVIFSSSVRCQARRPVAASKALSSSQLPPTEYSAIALPCCWATWHTVAFVRVYDQTVPPVRASRPVTVCAE